MIGIENRSVFARGWVWKRELTPEGQYKGILEGDGKALYLDNGGDDFDYTFEKTYRTVQQKGDVYCM